LLVLTFYQSVVGIWALFFPRSFYVDFPVPGHPLVARLPAFNEHLIRDVGEFNLAFAFILAASAIGLHYTVIRLVLIGYEFAAVPHFIYHAVHLGGFPVADAIVQTVGLGAIAVLPLALIGLTIVRSP
jgi:hypothetical protein